ncbi:MAG: DUF123 domain-containing protein, partial [Spirochaetaceae bacterium]|nr:DUF123 domain-containing protein [Spirochaetaceae bacterium]
VCSYLNLECALAENLALMGGVPVAGFGSSDCRCGSHLYYFPYPPEGDRAFMEMLFRFRHIEGLKVPPPRL